MLKKMEVGMIVVCYSFKRGGWVSYRKDWKIDPYWTLMHEGMIFRTKEYAEAANKGERLSLGDILWDGFNRKR